jgi:hypothetical protein
MDNMTQVGVKWEDRCKSGALLRILQVIREWEGDSIPQFCKKTGIDDSALYLCLERDSVPKVDAIAKICNTYNISSDWIIMGRAGSPYSAPIAIARRIFRPLPLIPTVAFGIDIVSYNVEYVWPSVSRQICEHGWTTAEVSERSHTNKEFIEYLSAGNTRIQHHELVDFVRIALYTRMPAAEIFKIKIEAYNNVMTTRDENGNTTSRQPLDTGLDADTMTNTQMIADHRLQYDIIEAIIDAVSPDEGHLLHIYSTLNDDGKKDLIQRAKDMMDIKRFSDRSIAADFEKQDTSQKSA